MKMLDKPIYEFEFTFSLHDRTVTAQQSGFTWENAKDRVRSTYPDAKDFKLKRKLKYPHSDGGKPIRQYRA
jgi:hypothetical protein